MNAGQTNSLIESGKRIGILIVSLDWGLNAHGNRDLLVGYYLKGEDQSKKNPMYCSMKTMLKKIKEKE